MASTGECFLGIDVGSVSVNTVVLTARREILEEHYTRTQGQPLATAHRILQELLSRIASSQLSGIALTGSGGKSTCRITGGTI